MATEIIEQYDDLKPFHYLLSLSFNQFKSLTERSGKEYKDKDRKACYTDMIKFCKSVIKAKGSIKRLYSHSLNTPKGLGGRLFCGCSIQGIPKEIRGLLMKHTTDIDMKNAHPVILSYICHKNNIPCPYLDYYIENREEILSKFPDREVGKNTILKQLNKDEKTAGMGIDEFADEVLIIQRKVVALDEFNGFEETIDKKKSWNKNGSYLNKIMCYYENLILESARKAIKTYDDNIQIRALMFDGTMPEGDFYDNMDLLKHITDYVNNEFEGLNMQWDYKQHDDSIEIPDDFELIAENTKPKIKQFEEDLVEFEKHHCLIVNKALFIKTRFDTGDYILMTKSELLTAYGNMYFEEHKGDKVVKSSFIQNWVSCNHPNINKKDDVDIYPDNSKCPKHIFNLWVPFEMEKKTEPYTDNKEGLNFILNHVLILCGNEKPVYDYFVLWIAQMIQFPEVKTIMPTLISKEGSGKGTLMKLFRRMLGTTKILETTNPSRDVWGDFNGIMTNTFLVNLNELSKKDTLDSSGKIKGLITDPTIDINSKGKNQFTVKSMHRLIATTNNEDPIQSMDGDRRNLIIRSSDEKKGNIDYFNKINKFLDDDIVVRTCYDYFKSLKGADKFGDVIMPVTEYQRNIKKKNVPAPEQWLESFVRLHSNETTIELFGKEIYDYFCIWALQNGVEYKSSAISLGLFFKNRGIDGITKGRHTKNGDLTTLNIEKLKKYFNMGCLIDTDL